MFVCLYICFARVGACMSVRGGGGGGWYVFCKSGIITIPHLKISIPFAMFNLLRGAIFQGKILRGWGNFLGAIHLPPIHPTLNGLFYLISRV